MFIGREKEIKVLEDAYSQEAFQMVVVYGRRRIGKTTLLDQFVRNKPSLYFTAQQKSATMNLRYFSQEVYRFFGLPLSAGSFETWKDALGFVAENAQRRKEPFVFVFDEFPYAAESDPSLPSVLQAAIDHDFKSTAICMVLCGSNEGFMESEVLGKKSPLYGRRTAQIKLQPFDYLDAMRFFPQATVEESLHYYAAFGGAPYYLTQIRASESFRENVARLFFDMSGILYAEPQMLLKQELREPALYNSVLDAIASGATNPKEISEKSGVSNAGTGRYLKTLTDLGIIERIVPFGENALTSRKGLYRIKDPYFAYWYRFVSPNIGAIEMGAGEAVAQRAFGESFSTYVGTQFEQVCLQWLIRQNQKGALPFIATSFGRWWGADPSTKEQTDIDIVIADRTSKSALFGECKWRNTFNETAAIEALLRRANLVKGHQNDSFVLFTKNEVSEKTKKRITELPDFSIVTANQMFQQEDSAFHHRNLI